MRRRDFITLVAGTAAGWPLAVRAQQLPTVGFLHAGLADGYSRETAGFRKGLNEAGYLDGRNVVIEYRWAKWSFRAFAGFGGRSGSQTCSSYRGRSLCCRSLG